MKEVLGNCPFEFNKNYPPCIVVRTFQWAYLKDFIEDKKKGKLPNDLMIAHNIDCIEFKNNYISIKNEKCIKCMFCVFGCEGNYIEIQNNYNLFASCSNFKVEYQNKISENEINKWFNKELIKLPILELSHIKLKYRSFQEFTEVNETKNIAIWSANTMRFLSFSKDCRIGTEIKMVIQARDRGGRLDICLLSDNHLIIAETKVSFRKMMQENRYLSQMLAYQEEIENILTEIQSELTHYKFLLIDGTETDLLPDNHSNCTSREGNQTKMFYDNLRNHNLFFISANALLLLGLLKLFKGNNYSIENVLDKITRNNNLGLLSCGVVNKNLEIISLCKFIK